MECKITSAKKATNSASIPASQNFTNTRISLLLSENVYSKTSEKCPIKYIETTSKEINHSPRKINNSSLTFIYTTKQKMF